MYYIGYITTSGVNSQDGKSVYLLKIPNIEVRGWYTDIIDRADINGNGNETTAEDKPIDMGNTHHESNNDDDDEDKYSCILG